MLFTTVETLAGSGVGPSVDLYADASDLGGVASVQRVHLPPGSLGATPHLHRLSTELFFVVGGSLALLYDDEIREIGTGALAAIEPETVHAFAAGTDGADALIVLTPGVERFGYFRLLAGVMAGETPHAELMAAQERYDNVFVESARWDEYVETRTQLDQP